MHLLGESDQLVRGTVGLLNADPAYPALDFGHQAYMMIDDQRDSSPLRSRALESPNRILLVSLASPVVNSNLW
jgi:hypothetical protein